MRRASCAALAAVAFGALVGCEGRPRQITSTESETKSASFDGTGVAEIDLSHGVPELPAAGLFGTTSHRTHADLVHALVDLEKSEAKGVLVKIGGASVALARAQEIGSLLAEIKKKGKPVVCHADGYTNATLLLASKGCSEIWLTPSGEVEAIGIAAQLVFGNKLLEKLHVGVDFLQMGKYKGAEEPFTRDSPSPEARESLEGTLRGMRTAWIDDIVQGRNDKSLEAAVEDGPYTADESLVKHLVDKLGYFDEAKDAAKKEANASSTFTDFGPGASPAGATGFAAVVRALGGTEGGGIGAHVAVVPAIGAISMASASALPWNNTEGITEKDLGRVLTRVTSDNSVKAVVLRIDSPGGSALASDLLWKRLMKLREKKPLVVSVGGMAASGGYYLACTGNKIVAEPTSILGSIGVVGGKLSFGKTAEEIGVHAETIAANPDPAKATRAAYNSLFTSWDDATRERMRVTMQTIYDLFLKRVGEGRGVAPDKIAPNAQGRIYGGVEAKERGMIDELGGLEDAIVLARKLGDLSDDVPAELVSESGGIFDVLEGKQQQDDAEEKASASARRFVTGGAFLETFFEARPEAAALLASMAPFASGEHTLAALPFGLAVR